ncbi:hypothetical protein BV509_17165 [Rhodovulum sulfidophilum]|uniref:Tellurite resistance TerB family protein n=1 Tax=Rhodovulum visakhapatnamense TaxID=364297 RepID=A0ABS1RK37_9RHOB|nr:tellurite resistance TerB family protein [Rhodovulum visakhapatnamense]MBL3569453.1 tellurite resistance TerB family protein [Rhodovulum visakhapatnamense]MBL3580015.1 tellurite resistance TerB family protein [Rhodovulum visakhapatnamense]OLS45915.1 hypothetical protein BV509_17165 [Rhodovulum sulfidophilum]
MNIERLLQEALGSGQGQRQNPGRGGSALPGGLAGGAAAGGLVALLLGSKKARKLGGKALSYGGMAAVGGLAYKAWRDWQQNRPSGTEADPLHLPPPPADSGFDMAQERDSAGQDFRLAVLRAMILAAKSDGHIDGAEHGRIRDRIEALGLGAEEKATLFDSFAAPADPAEAARPARTDAQRAELYLASALAVDPDTPDERRYLDDLARHLALPEGLRGHLDLEAEAARRQVGA